jgi:hypothetical protein
MVSKVVPIQSIIDSISSSILGTSKTPKEEISDEPHQTIYAQIKQVEIE